MNNAIFQGFGGQGTWFSSYFYDLMSRLPFKITHKVILRSKTSIQMVLFYRQFWNLMNAYNLSRITCAECLTGTLHMLSFSFKYRLSDWRQSDDWYIRARFTWNGPCFSRAYFTWTTPWKIKSTIGFVGNPIIFLLSRPRPHSRRAYVTLILNIWHSSCFSLHLHLLTENVLTVLS